MATRYYLRRSSTFTGSAPANEQSPDVPSPFSFEWGVSGTIPSLRDLSLASASSPFDYNYYAYARSTALVTGAYWAGWWRTQPFASGAVLAGGTAGFYIAHGNSSSVTGSAMYFSASYYQGSKPTFHVYQWRPGTGVIATLIDRATGSIPPRPNDPTAHVMTFSSSFPYTGATLAAGDMLVYELWVTASLSNSITTGQLNYGFWYNGSSSVGTHDGFGTFDQASWIEFSEDLPAFQSPSFSPSSVYVKDVKNHTTDPNKVRVTFSGPISTGSIDASNFSIVPTVIVQHAAAVPGTNNSQIDLHFGEDIPLSSSTLALWRFDEVAGSSCNDDTGTYTLTATSTILSDGLFKRARSYTAGQKATSVATLTPRQIILGEWTVDALFRWTSGDDYATIVAYSGIGNSSNGGENYLMFVGIRPTGRPVIYWESGSSFAVANHTLSSDFAQTSGQWTLMTVRKSLMSGTNGDQAATYQVDFFLDGKLAQSFSDLRNASSGTSANMAWSIGSDKVSGIDDFVGTIDTVRVTSGALSDEAIVNLRNNLFPLTRGQTYLFSASNVYDTNGSLIMEPSSSFYFQYLGYNGAPITGGLELNRVFGSASYSIPGGIEQSGSLHFDLYVDYDPTVDCNIVYTPPTVVNFVPAIGTTVTKFQPIQFDVTDDGPFRRIIVQAKYATNLIQEIVHDGIGFGLKYQGGLNVQTTIAGGFRYTMLRDGGWPESPVLTPFAIDVSGSENL